MITLFEKMLETKHQKNESDESTLDSVRTALEDLFNHQCVSPACATDLSASVLGYGLNNISGNQNVNTDDLVRSLKIAVRDFEPRVQVHSLILAPCTNTLGLSTLRLELCMSLTTRNQLDVGIEKKQLWSLNYEPYFGSMSLSSDWQL